MDRTKVSYRIQEVVELLHGEYPDMSSSALRFWEREGLLKPSESTGGGQRRYTEADIHRIRAVKELAKRGFSLDRINAVLRKLLDGQRSPDMLPWLVQAVCRKQELEIEARAVLALSEAQRQEPLYLRKSLLRDAGHFSLHPVLAAPIWRPDTEARTRHTHELRLEQVKGQILRELEEAKIVLPSREDSKWLYSKTDRLIFFLAVFFGGMEDLEALEELLSSFARLRRKPELPWQNPEGRIKLENVLFNLTVGRCLMRDHRKKPMEIGDSVDSFLDQFVRVVDDI